MRLTARILVTYLALTLLFTGAMTAAFCIPTSAIDANVKQSVEQVTADGKMFTLSIGPVEPYKLGVFSDCLILGIAYCGDSSHPLQSAMSDKFMMKDGSPIIGARQMFDADSSSRLQPVIYSRYWHGNQVVIRPLLCVTTVHGIRIINIVLLAVLWLALLVVMWRRTDPASALIVMLCLAAVMIPSVPLCLNYVSTFVIALTASLVILLWRPATASRDNAVITFMVIGAVTTFLDLLTTPLVTMAVPLVAYMLQRRPQRTWRTVILLSLAWLLGYASLWATKWLLAALITGHATLTDAMGAVTQRTVGHDEGDYMLWCLKATAIIFAAVCLLTAAVSALFGKSRLSLRRHSWMLLVALSSFVWAFVLLEHTWHHLHFTWRTFVVLAIGLGLYWRHTLELKHLNNNDKRL